jgi:cell division protein FtsN
VAPSDFPGLQWAPVAGIRIFCWDKQSLPANEAGIIAAGFAEAGCPLTAVATFHEAGPVAERLVEEVLTEVEPGEKVPPSGREAAPDQIPTGAPDSTAGKKDVASGVEAGSDSPPAAAGDVAAPAEPESVPPPVQGPTPPSDPLLTRETSRVFWWGALAAVALIAMITVYYFKFVRVPTTVTQESLEVAAQADPSPATGQRDFAGGEADGGEVGAVTDAGADARDSLVVAAAGDSLAGVNRETTPGLEQAAADPPDAAPDAAPDAGTVSPADPGSPEEQLPEPVKPAASGFDMEPYRQPVGSRGWALHVFSLPSQAATREQVQELTRRGFQSEVRVFDLGDKGIWNRVYLGSFSSRDEAREAMPALLEKLREKWAKPVRF